MQFTLETPVDAVTEYLKQHDLISNTDKVLHLDKPGDGNMNMLIRVTTNETSVIVKQSRPYVNKFPQIPAPKERIHVEGKFYLMVQQDQKLREHMPKLLSKDDNNFLIVLEDLVQGNDYTYVYRKNNGLTSREVEELVLFLNRLHHASFTDAERNTFPDNMSLRKLNHEHLFHYPYVAENGFDLDTVQQGLQEASLEFKNDIALKRIMVKLGNIYMSRGDVLLHGDFYPGSWLKTGYGPKVIDPEFCFFGKAENR